jgi:two-component system chemotaxis sensor kinase CheA
MPDPILDIFREEARDHLGALEKGFLDLEATAGAEARRALIDSLFRHAHSLKGDAKVVGLSAERAERGRAIARRRAR